VDYVIKVTIRGIRPPIWRRLRVRGSLTFAQLHKVLQAAFGWLDYHLYRFSFKDGPAVMYEDPAFPATEFWGERVRVLNPDETAIESLFEKYRRCVYEYDFGDSWRHEIVVEKKLPTTESGSLAAVCLGGRRHRPPEDVGGVLGYQEFLAIIQDENNPERDEYLDWARKDTDGRDFDPEYFNLDEINERLSYALEDTPENARDLFMTRTGLRGLLRLSGAEPIIEVGDRQYRWSRLGELLMMLEEGLTVTVKVGRRRRTRR